MRVAVMGDGGWGTALALVLLKRGHDVTMWGAFPEQLAETEARRENARFLPGVTLPEALSFNPDAAGAAGAAELVVAAVPTQYMARVLEEFGEALPKDAVYVSVAKGIEVGTLRRPSEIIRDAVGDVRLAVLSGPSHAEEVARGNPTTVVAAAEDETLSGLVQEAFTTQMFRVYTNRDVVGVELAAALKNVVAIAAGIAEGLNLGDNGKAALLTRGLAEIARLGVAAGAERLTFQGLAGMGDLVVTCISRHGRNRAVGLRIGKGESVQEIQASMNMVAEGIETTKSACALAEKLRVEMPIANAVREVLFEGADPKEAVSKLMTRRLKPEQY